MDVLWFCDATLINGSCLRVLPELETVDGVLTDPPYSSGALHSRDRAAPAPQKYAQSGCGGRHLPNFDGESRDQRSFTLFNAYWAEMARDLATPGAVIGAFSDWRQLPVTTDYIQLGGWTWRGIALWDKPAARPQRGRFAAAAEYLVWGSNGALPVDRGVDALKGCFRVPFPRKREHLTQKPVELMEELVRIVKPGGIVLDPFMGSGTTGIAALRSGRPFIGIESDEAIFEIAARRIRAEVEALSDRRAGGGR